ncbi:MAG TPA: N-acetylornithine carbamoyltransferase [Planctomycetes bacterium]|nr:N-acetylornithine carbamoyltransferase [Planctomycetota bacterium]HIL37558.1 N-acetylornithine carbamoyltransferase [Planctomycetota bacterium]
MSQRSAPRHFLRLCDLADREIDDILDLGARLRRGVRGADLANKTVGLLFFRGSLRTRSSFEVALNQLGGHALNLNAKTDFWRLEERAGTVMDGEAPEHICDAAAVLSCYADALAIRPALAGKSWERDRQDTELSAWAQHSQVPVINMESALWHPLQALADLMTLRDALGKLPGKRLAITWTRSPSPGSPAVVHSILMAALRAGMNVSLAHPKGFNLEPSVMDEARSQAETQGATLELGHDMDAAARDAHVVYARSWWPLESYGNATLTASRLARETGWCVDERTLALGQDARLMHPMPVRRNLEVSDEVLDGPRSLAIDQAANRLHTQKGLLSLLFRPS